MRKLIFIILIAIAIAGCKKEISKPEPNNIEISDIPKGYFLSATFKIVDIKKGSREDFFTVRDDKYIFTANVICCTAYKVGDNVTGYILNGLLVVNNYQIPRF